MGALGIIVNVAILRVATTLHPYVLLFHVPLPLLLLLLLVCVFISHAIICTDPLMKPLNPTAAIGLSPARMPKPLHGCPGDHCQRRYTEGRTVTLPYCPLFNVPLLPLLLLLLLLPATFIPLQFKV